MRQTPAHAKINLALVVGPARPDGNHEVATVLQAVDLHDDVTVEPAGALVVDGFAGDTLVGRALELLAGAAGVAPAWRVTLEKRIPVAAGLGGGSSDAAAALALANAMLPSPLPPRELSRLAATVGADVPFFLGTSTALASADGTVLEPLELPCDYSVVLLLPHGEAKESTAAVYAHFDERRGHEGFAARREALLGSLAAVREAHDLAALPGNDLASSPLARELERLGAFRADVSGAGPVLYGLFERETDAARAEEALRAAGRTWLVRPVSEAPGG